MKAIVLAAGIGKRLAPITVQKPKVLVKIGKKTLIEKNIVKLQRIDITEIALVIGHKGDEVRKLLGDSVTYYYQKEQLGTAHAFLCARKFVDESHFLGMNGDIFFTDPLDDFIRLEPPVIAVHYINDTRKYGRLKIKEGRLVTVEEKAKKITPGFINAGIYLFPKQIFKYIKKTTLSPRKEYEITDTISMLVDQGVQFTTYELKGFWIDIADTADLEKARQSVSTHAENANL